MPFQKILDQLKNQEIEYPQDPRTPTSFSPNENVTKALLNIIGDKRQDEGVTESMSPIDFLPVNEMASLAGRGIKAGAQGLMEAAPRLVGNEIGSVGNLKALLPEVAEKQAPKLEAVLDPSKEARMARAKEMGFDTDKTYYHGTKADIQNFDPKNLGNSTQANSAKQGFFFAEDPSTASDYSKLASSRDQLNNKGFLTDRDVDLGNIADDLKKQKIDLDVKTEMLEKRKSDLKEKELFFTKKLKEITDPEDVELFQNRLNSIQKGLDNLWKEENNLSDKYIEMMKKQHHIDEQFSAGENVIPVHLKTENPFIHDYKGTGYRDESYADIMRKAKELGHDSVIFKNTFDPANPRNRIMQDIVSVFDPSQIRSVNAMFDPAKKSSSDILAGLGGAALLGSQMDDGKFSELNKLLNQK